MEVKYCMFAINHDHRNDVLYIGMGDRSNSYGDEISSGIILLYDMDTEELTGVTILDFLEKYNSNKLDNIPVAINFERDVIPLL